MKFHATPPTSDTKYRRGCGGAMLPHEKSGRCGPAIEARTGGRRVLAVGATVPTANSGAGGQRPPPKRCRGDRPWSPVTTANSYLSALFMFSADARFCHDFRVSEIAGALSRLIPSR